MSTSDYCDSLNINETPFILNATNTNKNKLDTLKGFRTAHLNITSIPKYIDELRIYLVNKPLDTLTINETRLDESISESVVYTRDILNVREISQVVPENIESFCLEIIKPKSKPFSLTIL